MYTKQGVHTTSGTLPDITNYQQFKSILVFNPPILFVGLKFHIKNYYISFSNYI